MFVASPRFLAFAALLSLGLAAPANAQFGGLGKLVGQAKSTISGTATESATPAMTGDEADQFLGTALRSTKNVMIATALLAQAVTDRSQLSSRKAQIDALTNAQNFKEVGAYRANLASDLAVLNERKDLAAQFQTAYAASSASEKKILGVAVVNLVIGIARNVDLVNKAPGLLDAVKRNPQLVARIGQFKLAGELVGIQGKGLAGVVGTMPKLIAAAKVRAPANAKATEPTAVSL